MRMLFTSLALAAFAAAGFAPYPAAKTGPVDFATQVKPILETRCLNCHARGKYKAGLSLEDRAGLVQGGESGPAIVPGKADDSLLVQLVSGDDAGG